MQDTDTQMNDTDIRTPYTHRAARLSHDASCICPLLDPAMHIRNSPVQDIDTHIRTPYTHRAARLSHKTSFIGLYSILRRVINVLYSILKTWLIGLYSIRDIIHPAEYVPTPYTPRRAPLAQDIIHRPLLNPGLSRVHSDSLQTYKRALQQENTLTFRHPTHQAARF